MSVKAGMVLAAVALATCGGSGAPDEVQAQIATARTYDVAGVSIGMDAKAAEAALVRMSGSKPLSIVATSGFQGVGLVT